MPLGQREAAVERKGQESLLAQTSFLFWKLEYSPLFLAMAIRQHFKNQIIWLKFLSRFVKWLLGCLYYSVCLHDDVLFQWFPNFLVLIRESRGEACSIRAHLKNKCRLPQGSVAKVVIGQ